MKKLLPLVLCSFLLLSCSTRRNKTASIKTMTRHASLLQMEERNDGTTLCRVLNPWKEGEVMGEYLIDGTFCRLTLTNSCHAHLLSELGAIGSVAVMCEPEYVASETVRAEIERGRIVGGGSGKSPNIETILAQECDAIIVSPFENQSVGQLAQLPIPIIYSAEYMETSPLAQAEWMRFYGRLVGRAAEADSLFTLVEENYLRLSTQQSALSSELQEKTALSSGKQKNVSQKLLAEQPFQGTWFVPGGSSTMGQLYADAGFDYPWAEDLHSGSLPLSEEAVLSIAGDADVWILKYYAEKEWSLDEFLVQNPFFAQFKAARNGCVFGCNTCLTDYYDVIPFRPDILLDELISLGSNQKPAIGHGKYFKKFLNE